MTKRQVMASIIHKSAYRMPKIKKLKNFIFISIG
jgi:hypothetical protein